MTQKLHSGQKAPVSGQYGRVTSSGKLTKKEVTVSKGETLPPTPSKGQGFILVDKTKH